MIVKAGGLSTLLNNMRNIRTEIIMKERTRAICNLCRGIILSKQLIQEMIITLSTVIQVAGSDQEIIANSICMLSGVCRQDDQITMLVNTGITPCIVASLE